MKASEEREVLEARENNMEIANILKQHIVSALKALSIESESVTLEHPSDLSNGDYSTNIAMALSKKLQMKPREVAEKIVAELTAAKIKEIEKIEIAGPGFINFHLSKAFFVDSVKEIARGNVTEGKALLKKKVIFDYTQPNPFKEFHIGHLMNNMIGEAISRFVESNGAEVKRATYHGDVGLHVAKTIWGMKKLGLTKLTVKEMGKAYATGNSAYDDDAEAKAEIISINKKVYERSDEETNKLYDEGKQISFDEFERMYALLGSTFDFHFLESESGPIGKEIVQKNIGGIFEESEGAVIFKGENYGLHTRVFLNKEGLPTYEAKEIGLTELKTRAFPADIMVTITANEQNAFFTVTAKAIELIFPQYKDKIVHISHGMLKLPSGKMSSRTGTVITAESLINDIEAKVEEKIKDREYDSATKEDIVKKVALGALRYSILRQAAGGDIIFDFEKSVSFEGDSGPYLQYACVRAQSVIAKAKEEGIAGDGPATETVSNLEKLLYRFNEVSERAALQYEPHHMVTYLIELAGEYNNYYAHNKIIDKGDTTSPYKVNLTKAFVEVMKKGLSLLAIEIPQKM